MAADELREYVRQINARITDEDYEPEFDDKDLKKDKELRILHSTRREAGGTGIPMALVIGKGIRGPRGWELALQDMVQGQRCTLQIRPEYGYKHKDCQMKPPKGVDVDESMQYDMQLLQLYSKDDVRVVGVRDDIYKTVKRRSESWETPREPYEVEVSCTARVPSTSGRQCDSTPYFTSPRLSFAMGSKTVPAGLQEGLMNMSKGEKAVLSCPREYASGGTLIPAPPDDAARIEFELQLLSLIQVRDMTGNKEVMKRRIKEGRGQFPMDCPITDSRVRIHYRGFLPDTGVEFVNSRQTDAAAEPFEFETGVGILPEAIDLTDGLLSIYPNLVRLMTCGEVSRISSSSRYAYDGRQDRPPEVPEGSSVEFEVELVSFEKQPDWERAPPDAKIQRAGELKQQGNTAFRSGQIRFARDKYTKALRLTDRMLDIETEEQAEAASLVKTACLVNLANCAQRQQKYGEALDWCNKALQESSDHAKAFYRRAMAYSSLGSYDKAKSDLLKWKELEPTQFAEADMQLLRLRKRKQAASVKQRQQFKDFFDRT